MDLLLSIWKQNLGFVVEKLEIWMDLGRDKLGFYKNSRKFGLKVIKIDLG